MLTGTRGRVVRAVATAAAIVAVGLGLATLLHVGPVGATTSFSLPRAAVAAEAQDGMTPISGMTAPPITLVDQHGRPFSLRSLRDRAVVLTFLDPVCWVECPLQAQEMRLSLRYLPASARSRVALVAVAANSVVHSLAAVRAFNRTEGLTGLPNWYFVTSPSLATLSRVWRSYYVSVSAPRDGMVDHTLAFYLIAPGGQVRYLSQPSDTTAAFVGTAELLAAYTGRILGVVPAFPSAGPSASRVLPSFSTPTALQSKASLGVTMRSATHGWRVVWRQGYEVLERTTDAGHTWRDVSPAGVTKHGGLYAAYGAGGQAWVVVLPWGYSHTPVTFYTDDWGTTWRYTGVWPDGTLDGRVARPLAASGASAFWLTTAGLFEARRGGAWRRVAALPGGIPAGASLRALGAGSAELTGAAAGLVWHARAGWRALGP